MGNSAASVTILLALFLPVVGCVPSAKGLRGDHFFERGEYRKAAHSYREALAADADGAQPDRLLLRLSLAYLLDDDGAPAADEAGATSNASATLDRLLSEHPGSDYRPIAQALRRSLAELSQLRGKKRADSDQLESLRAEADTCREQTETLKGALEAQEQRLSSATSQGDQHAAEVEELQARIGRQKKRIKELKRALAALKRIDMQRSR